MADTGSSVTLIFYKIGDEWWKEPALNLLAAVAQMSSYCHCEIGIGESAGTQGQIKNVCRIYNDAVGVELTERTGRNPHNTYLSLGCSKAAEQRMLAFAKAQVGKPFSNAGMARSLIWPRRTSGESFFCAGKNPEATPPFNPTPNPHPLTTTLRFAELVASVLKVGGLLSQDSNAGAATPTSLYKMYARNAAVAANPYTLRAINGQNASLSFNSLCKAPSSQAVIAVAKPSAVAHKRSDSPPKASFKLLSNRRSEGTSPTGLTITLNSLR